MRQRRPSDLFPPLRSAGGRLAVPLQHVNHAARHKWTGRIAGITGRRQIKIDPMGETGITVQFAAVE